MENGVNIMKLIESSELREGITVGFEKFIVVGTKKEEPKEKPKHEIKQKETKLKNKPIYQDNGFIFAREDGHPQLRKVFETRLQRLLKKAGITKNITPHSFRHTHASLMFEAGATIKEVMERLGHTDPKTTTVIYTHVTQSTKEKTSQQFSKLMKGLLN